MKASIEGTPSGSAFYFGSEPNFLDAIGVWRSVFPGFELITPC